MVAGGRRFAQAKALAAAGVLGPDHPVPCRIQPDAEAARELSLVENVVRAAMHPADQVVAFRALADEGETAAPSPRASASPSTPSRSACASGTSRPSSSTRTARTRWTSPP